MKASTLKQTLIFLALGLMVACGSGNSSKNSSNVVTTVPPKMPTVDGKGQPTPPNTPTPPVSSDRLIDLINIHPQLASVYQGLSMEVDLGVVVGKFGELDANYGGDITVHKKHKNGSVSYSYFTSGGSTLDDVKENYWHYNSDGDLVWRGVFEGPRGTLVLVVDGVYKSGDGSDPYDYMSGSLWFRKWPTVADTGINSDKCYLKDGRVDCKNPSGPLVRCWDVSLGPYDCRFRVSADSKNVTAIGNKYTDEPYVKIAEFIDLSREKTFKENY